MSIFIIILKCWQKVITALHLVLLLFQGKNSAFIVYSWLLKPQNIKYFLVLSDNSGKILKYS